MMLVKGWIEMYVVTVLTACLTLRMAHESDQVWASCNDVAITIG